MPQGDGAFIQPVLTCLDIFGQFSSPSYRFQCFFYPYRDFTLYKMCGKIIISMLREENLPSSLPELKTPNICTTICWDGCPSFDRHNRRTSWLQISTILQSFGRSTPKAKTCRWQSRSPSIGKCTPLPVRKTKHSLVKGA